MAKDNLKHNCSDVNKMISEGLLFTYGKWVSITYLCCYLLIKAQHIIIYRMLEKKSLLLPHLRKSINIFQRWILSQRLLLDLAFYRTHSQKCLSKHSFLPACFYHIILYFYNLYFYSYH